MYRLELTEEEVAIILQALNNYTDISEHITQEQWDIANEVMNKIDNIL
jgi:hypothetical protein